MIDSTETSSAAEVIADLARRTEAATVAESYIVSDSADSIIVRVERNDESTVVHDLESKLERPRRNRGTASLYDPSDFAAYTRRLADAYTTVWGDENNGRFTAVFNDHADSESAGWRDHTAVLQLQDDPEWTAWLKFDNKWFTQMQFAEFLEEHAAVIIEPNPADFLEVASTFKAHKKADFSSGVDLTTGDVQLTYNEETTAKTTKAGQIEVPRQFTVSIAPFLGTTPRPVAARLRWTIDEGALSIGYKLHRPDLVKRDAFADIRQALVESLAAVEGDDSVAYDGVVPVLLGAAPRPVDAQR
ncbi:DUF2303 family protein [Amycolatopsis thermoflava]|uniref:DUF2303 family protein n=1 Tax=Amycolatopsis thermoflava TaxID=84480 RepID=UPI003F4A0D77